MFVGDTRETAELDVDRYPLNNIQNFKEFKQALVDIRDLDHDFTTLVIDNLTFVEALIKRSICEAHNVDSIEKAGGGYGKGFTEVDERVEDVINLIEQISDSKEMDIIVIAHAKEKAHNAPGLEESYDRWVMSLEKKTNATVMRRIPNILFAMYEEKTTKTKTGKVIGVDTDKRFFRTNHKPAYDAKNRGSLPDKMEMNWALVKQMYGGGVNTSSEELTQDILSTMDGLDKKIQEAIKKQVSEAGSNKAKLMEIKKKVVNLTSAS